jgi:hypothetical protein
VDMGSPGTPDGPDTGGPGGPEAGSPRWGPGPGGGAMDMDEGDGAEFERFLLAAFPPGGDVPDGDAGWPGGVLGDSGGRVAGASGGPQ